MRLKADPVERQDEGGDNQEDEKLLENSNKSDSENEEKKLNSYVDAPTETSRIWGFLSCLKITSIVVIIIYYWVWTAANRELEISLLSDLAH